MITFGVDYQQTVTVLCQREGHGAAAQLALLDDGRHWLIPTAAASPDRWGSAAPEGSAGRDPAGFWRGLHRRLARSLGRDRLTPRDGTRVVVSVLGESAAVAGLARDAGLYAVTVVPAAAALLCRWLGEQAARPDGLSAEVVVAAVVLGERGGQVLGCRAQLDRGRSGRVLATGPLVSLPDDMGLAAWAWEVGNVLHGPGSVPAAAWREAVIEWASALAAAPPDQPVEWAGPLPAGADPAALPTRRRCLDWPAARLLRAKLQTEVFPRALAPLGGRAQWVLVGGCGAAGPFLTGAVAAEGTTVWQGSHPALDLAAGAACWPDGGEAWVSLLQPGVAAAPAAERPSQPRPVPASKPGSPGRPLPPRGGPG